MGQDQTVAVTSTLADLEARAATGAAFTRAEAERVLACPDLISVGVIGEAARKAHRGDRVTYGRVLVLTDGLPPASGWTAGEVRLIGRPATTDEAVAWVQRAKTVAGTVPLTGFSVADLVDLAGGDHLALADLARSLSEAGLDAVAELPIDAVGDTENAIEVVRAVQHGGLGVWRATVERADARDRLDLVERAVVIQRETSALRAFAPLPRVDPRDTPSTGYDDVRTVTIARVMCAGTVAIQMDWPLYGPKLAQVAIAYGADDIDGVDAVDDPAIGARRLPAQDVERQVRAAFATPTARNGRYEPAS
jgi:hypothetical protein